MTEIDQVDTVEKIASLKSAVDDSYYNVACPSSRQSVKHRKMFCRYGRGCTHISDPLHNDRFWHPPIPRIDDDQKRTHYICNECAYSTQSLHDLQLHLQRKTAWSNLSLVGCRICCLVEFKEWHEGYVAQYHRAGKHLIQFRVSGESKWMLMKKVVFYILERPVLSQNRDENEYKEGDVSQEGYLAPIEDDWVYVEDISLDFAFAQSVLFKVYGSVIQETGHKTRGHICLTEDDKDWVAQNKGSFLYGELLPRGANKAFGIERLNLSNASTLFDLGMGTGKILVQAFLQYRNLQYVYGVELSYGRYCIAEEAVLRMIELLGKDTFKIQNLPGRYIIVSELISSTQCRVLHMECGDMFEVHNIEIADILMMETDVPVHLYPNLCELLASMHDGARLLSYLDLKRFWSQGICPFSQMSCNKTLSDRFPTSWSVQRGHHFYLWTKVLLCPVVDNGNILATTVPGIPKPPSVSSDSLEDNEAVDVKAKSSWWQFAWPFRRNIQSVSSFLKSDQNHERVIPIISKQRNIDDNEYDHRNHIVGGLSASICQCQHNNDADVDIRCSHCTTGSNHQVVVTNHNASFVISSDERSSPVMNGRKQSGLSASKNDVCCHIS